MKGLRDKVAVIVGGGGMGVPVARRLAEEGTAVVLGDLREAEAHDVAAAIRATGAQAEGVGVDISDEDSVAKLFEAAAGSFGGVDLMFANAADLSAATHGRDTDLLDAPLEVFDRTIAVDLRGYLLCTRHALPLMLERKGGAMVFTSSLAAHLGTSVHPYYAAAKSGVLALMRHIAARWGREGIRANAVSPGMILTPDAVSKTPPEAQAAHLKITNSPRLGEAEDIAALVTFLLSDECAFLQGATIDVNGGVLKR